MNLLKQLMIRVSIDEYYFACFLCHISSNVSGQKHSRVACSKYNYSLLRCAHFAIIVFHFIYILENSCQSYHLLQLLVKSSTTNYIIKEFQKLYDKTPATHRFARARILSGMKKLKRDFKNSG